MGIIINLRIPIKEPSVEVKTSVICDALVKLGDRHEVMVWGGNGFV